MNRFLLTASAVLPLFLIWQNAQAFEGRFHGGARGGGFHPQAPLGGGGFSRPPIQPRQGSPHNFAQSHPQARQNAHNFAQSHPQARQNAHNFAQSHPQARQNAQNFRTNHPPPPNNRDINISGNNVVVNRGPGWAGGGPVYVGGGNDYDWGEAIVGGLVGGAVGGLVAGAVSNASQPAAPAYYAAPPPAYYAPPPASAADSAASSASASSARSSSATAQSAASSAQSSAAQAQQAATSAQDAARQAQSSAQQAQQTAQQTQQPSQAGANVAPGGHVTYGTRFASIPDGCTQQTEGPISYQQCGADWLQPFMQGGRVVWMAVPPPR